MTDKLIVGVKKHINNEEKLQIEYNKGKCLMKFYEPLKEIVAIGFQTLEQYDIYTNLLLHYRVYDENIKELIRLGFKLRLTEIDNGYKLTISKDKDFSSFSENCAGESCSSVSNLLNSAEKWADKVVKELNITKESVEEDNNSEFEDYSSRCPFSDFV